MIPVNTPRLEGNAKKYLAECIDSGWVSSEGPFVSRFESEMAEKIGRRHAIAVTNGSAALDLAVAALGISKGDEVIIPAFTIISCAQSVIRAGAKPVLVDSDPTTWNMNVDQLEGLVTPRTKAIMPVHIYGLPVDMDPVLSLADARGLRIIEDASEAIGLDYKGRACGSLGDISTFSFYPNKTITTGEGGMVLTDDSHLAERCRSMRNLCFGKHERFSHEALGWNFRMSNMQAALGVAQLEQLDEHVRIKRHIGNRYQERLSALPISLAPICLDYAENLYWVFGVVLESEKVAKALAVALAEKKIGTRPFFKPMHKQPVLKNMGLFEGVSLPISERLYKEGLYLPSGMGLSDTDIDTVCDAVEAFFK